ncbi:putative apolipoprotein D-like [Penaeus vannamei]|uniref:Putative apolipoprotein D-like n=1 Tax=Penaeus vannamei TaxID=6689 RepID=A0A423TIR5_PENVA|nr:putative apolipoprotein D-like [Penaeus vannamei]
MAPSGGALCCVLLLVFLLQTRPVGSYIFKTGECPSVNPVSNFAFAQFAGTWHVIQSSNTASRCYSLSFSENGGSFFLTMNKQIFSLRAAGIVHNLRFESQIYPNPNNPASMVLRIPSNLYQDVSYQIISTDYTTWATAWSCKPTVFGHMESVLIMGRSRELPLSELRSIRLDLETAGVSVDELSSVQQTECNPDLGGGRFTLDLASDLADTLVDWTALIPSSTIPGLSPSGCFVQEGDFYLYLETCNATASNVIFDPNDPSEGNETGGEDDSADHGVPESSKVPCSAQHQREKIPGEIKPTGPQWTLPGQA